MPAKSKTPAKKPNPRGRPTTFNQEIADKICDRMANGESARAICRDPDMPQWSTLCGWKRRNEEFATQYARAREDLLDYWAEEIDEIAHDTSRDFTTDEMGRIRSDNTAVNRDRLKIDTRKWIMCKLSPKKYGDKLTQEISGPDSGPIPVINIGTKTSTPKS